MAIEGIVISLDRAIERHRQVNQIIAECPYSCQRLSAIDGSCLTPAAVNEFCTRQIYFPAYPFPLRPGEIGVFLSHRLAWKEILRRDLDGGLILEDDICFDLSIFPRALEIATKALEVCDVVKLPVPRRTNDRLESSGPPSFSIPRLIPLGATSMLVSRAGAERLLALTNRIDRPVDSFIQMTWVTNLTVGLVSPSGVTEISHQLGGSTIQSKSKTILQAAKREVRRLAYRQLIRYYSFRRKAS